MERQWDLIKDDFVQQPSYEIKHLESWHLTVTLSIFLALFIGYQALCSDVSCYACSSIFLFLSSTTLFELQTNHSWLSEIIICQCIRVFYEEILVEKQTIQLKDDIIRWNMRDLNKIILLHLPHISLPHISLNFCPNYYNQSNLDNRKRTFLLRDL